MNQNLQELTGKGVSPYDDNYWCRYCGEWVPQDEAIYMNGTGPRCPDCHKRVRTSPLGAPE